VIAMEKVLLVTGASSVVGMQLVNEIYGDYDRIYLQYRTMNEDFMNLLEECGVGSDIVPLQADFCNMDDIECMISKIKESGKLPNQIVHLPAPKAYNKQFHKDKWENYENGWEISVRSIVCILQAFIPDMVKNRYGRIVFMLTSCTHNYPAKFQSSYVTVKYALLGLMKSLSVEYADRGITVNGVSPDMMETKFLSDIPEIILKQNRENSPLGRNILVQEVTPVIRHMLSDLGASMTGQNIGITGGL
jgi:3-oxoacyl-[acyl-carrier protein] reductase